MKILLAGGAGYIGSHIAVELKEAGHEIIIVDNLSNSSHESLENLKKMIGEFKFYRVDIAKEKFSLDNVFFKEKIDAVIHLAAHKSVPESVAEPMKYYENNLMATLNLAHVMREYNVNYLVFSSSCSVYGEVDTSEPVNESFTVGNQTSPYAHTKALSEKILETFEVANGGTMWISYLRYFNPAGAHTSGIIGETDTASAALFPSIARSIKDDVPVKIYGNDYPTVDGTPLRDYIHIEDLASAHVLALQKVLDREEHDPIINIGTGTGQTVLEVIQAFSSVLDKDVKYEIHPRRAGDIGRIYASIVRAEMTLGWYPKKTLEDIAYSQWKWMNKS